MVRFGVFFRVMVGIDERFAVHDVDVEVMRTLNEVARKELDEVCDAVFLRFAEGFRNDGERVRDASRQ